MADTEPKIRGTKSEDGVPTAFVLSGRGSLAAVQVGMLQALADWGIRPDMLIGSSAGALNAAFAAGRGPSSETLTDLAAVWRSFGPEDISPFGSCRHRLTHPLLCSPNGLARLVSRRLPYERLEHAAVPVHLVITDVLRGREVLVSTGDAASALLASAGAPSVLTTAHVRHAAALGASRVVVLPAAVACALARPASAPPATAVHGITLQAAAQVHGDIVTFEGRVEVIVLPALCPLAVAATDFRHADELIDGGRQVTLRWLGEGGHRRPTPDALRALHVHPEVSARPVAVRAA